MTTAPKERSATTTPARLDSRALIQSTRSRELFLGVVGPAGAGGSRVIASLERACEDKGYTCELIKASNLIHEWALKNDINLPSESRKTLDQVRRLQDVGDQMRLNDPAEVACEILKEITRRRATAVGVPYVEGSAVQPNDVKRAYLIESIRHPAEVNLLRQIYANAFALIGVVCEETEREKRILGKYFTVPERQEEGPQRAVKEFMQRDSDDPSNPHGQHVADAFFAADFFLDNTASDLDDSDQLLDEPLARLISIISHDRVVRPSIEETAMHHAHSARVRSACLSRQVGAALVDEDGTIIATGVNEVPRPGGGVYGESFSSTDTVQDHRCVYRQIYVSDSFCSNNREQNKIIDELIDEFPELIQTADKNVIQGRIRKTRLGQLIEFSRAVHAEMDALLSAGREGVSTIGTRLFVTSFPCHYCARHIVSAGVYEVQFIEPYPKSLALELHDDAIEIDPKKWNPPERKSMMHERLSKEDDPKKELPGKVLFHPFVGVAPRIYIKAFEKTRELKDNNTGMFSMKSPEWGDEWAPFKLAYPELEAVLTRTT